jgi:hypothetical protein
MSADFWLGVVVGFSACGIVVVAEILVRYWWQTRTPPAWKRRVR